MFSPDGRWLATGCNDGNVRIWDISTRQEQSIPIGHAAPVTAVAVAPDGSWLATASADETARIWDLVEQRECVVMRGHRFTLTAVAIAPDGSWLATTSWDGTARIWDPGTGRQQIVLDHTNGSLEPGLIWVVAAGAASPDGRWLATVHGSRQGEVRVWDISTGASVARMRFERGVSACIWSENAGLVIGGEAGLHMLEFRSGANPPAAGRRPRLSRKRDT